MTSSGQDVLQPKISTLQGYVGAIWAF